MEYKIVVGDLEMVYRDKRLITKAIIEAAAACGPLKDRFSENALMIHADVVYDHNTRQFVKHRGMHLDVANTLLWMKRNDIDLQEVLKGVEEYV